MLGFFVVALDAQIVNVALPVIGAAFGAGLSDLQWVVAGSTLPPSSLLLFAGTLSDRVGAQPHLRRGQGHLHRSFGAGRPGTLIGRSDRGTSSPGRGRSADHTDVAGVDS